MGFVYKSGCIYVLITCLIWWLLKIKSLTKIFKVAGYVSARCVCSLEEHTKKLEINLKDLLCPFIFVHKWWKFTGVIRSACVLHLNESTLYQVESTAISDFECHPSQSFCLEFGSILLAFYFTQTLLSIQFSVHLEWQSSKLCLWFLTVDPCYVFPSEPYVTFIAHCITFTWPQANIEQRNLNRSCSRDKGNFLALCAQLIFWNAIQRLKIE